MSPFFLYSNTAQHLIRVPLSKPKYLIKRTRVKMHHGPRKIPLLRQPGYPPGYPNDLGPVPARRSAYSLWPSR